MAFSARTSFRSSSSPGEVRETAFTASWFPPPFEDPLEIRRMSPCPPAPTFRALCAARCSRKPRTSNGGAPARYLASLCSACSPALRSSRPWPGRTEAGKEASDMHGLGDKREKACTLAARLAWALTFTLAWALGATVTRASVAILPWAWATNVVCGGVHVGVDDLEDSDRRVALVLIGDEFLDRITGGACKKGVHPTGHCSTGECIDAIAEPATLPPTP
mmetsp:Transcript_59066/g.127795  ORF Transcript_59066/g.127795 Transcript_59066/m.127795 type:complete len:220 (-) Transcript_59066:8-667(-)